MANPPTTPLGVQLWDSSQAQSQAYANIQNAAYAAYLIAHPVFAPGEGSVAKSTFFTNGQEPNTGNT